MREDVTRGVVAVADLHVGRLATPGGGRASAVGADGVVAVAVGRHRVRFKFKGGGGERSPLAPGGDDSSRRSAAGTRSSAILRRRRSPTVGSRYRDAKVCSLIPQSIVGNARSIASQPDYH